MSKPLELTWYERDEDGDYIHPARYFISSIDVDYWTECKRLTDSELAAEVWRECEERTRNATHIIYGDLNNKFTQAAFERAIDRVNVLYRFATLPDYDEVA